MRRPQEAGRPSLPPDISLDTPLERTENWLKHSGASELFRDGVRSVGLPLSAGPRGPGGPLRAGGRWNDREIHSIWGWGSVQRAYDDNLGGVR